MVISYGVVNQDRELWRCGDCNGNVGGEEHGCLVSMELGMDGWVGAHRPNRGRVFELCVRVPCFPSQHTELKTQNQHFIHHNPTSQFYTNLHLSFIHHILTDRSIPILPLYSYIINQYHSSSTLHPSFIHYTPISNENVSEDVFFSVISYCIQFDQLNVDAF